jgi:uncharacterized membrane protein (DUF373 family)
MNDPPLSSKLPAGDASTAAAGRPREALATARRHRAERPLATRAAYLAEEVVRYGVMAGLVMVAGVVLVRSFLALFTEPRAYPETVVTTLDGVLVVIIVLDILRTVMSHLEGDAFPVRPFLVVGILAGIREILSASAHLTLTSPISPGAFRQGIIQVGVGLGVAVALGLVLLVLPTGGEEGRGRG